MDGRREGPPLLFRGLWLAATRKPHILFVPRSRITELDRMQSKKKATLLRPDAFLLPCA